MNICVFGSSSENINKEFLDSAEHLGFSIAKRNCGVVFGAGKYGVMGATARGVAKKKGKTYRRKSKVFCRNECPL